MFDIKTLEFDKILGFISEFAVSEEAKSLILSIEPKTNYNLVVNDLNETNELMNFITKLSDPYFNGLFGLKEIMGRIRVEAFLSIEDFLSLISLINNGNSLLDYKNNILREKLTITYLKYFDNIYDNHQILNEIKTVMNDNGEIYDNASLTLYDIRKKIRLQESSLKNKLTEILQRKAKCFTDALIASRNGKPCFPVKAEFKNSFQGIILDESSSGSTYYIEPLDVVEMDNKLISLKEEEKNEISRILMGLSVKTWKCYDDLKSTYDSIIGLEVIYAKAKYAIKTDSYMPMVNQKGFTRLDKSRHPLIPKDKCVPITLEIGLNHNGIIITGPNTGGKTVTLKTTGLLQIMAQSGILIPALPTSSINIYDNILADIGDEQSIEMSLSSFSAHMTKVINLINNSTENSLLLFDELGSGTDPKEGSNLAISIIEYILDKGSKLIVTTHYTDLKVFAYNHDSIINASVEFNTETLMPTYKLLLGVPGQSNALTIASRLGLNDEIVEKAKIADQESQTDLGKLMKKLDIENQRLNQELEDVLKTKDELEIKNQELEARDQELTKKYLNFERDAKKKAEVIILKAQEQAKELITELEEKLKSDSLKLHEVADYKHKVSELTGIEEEIGADFDIKVNDIVMCKDYNLNGVVQKIKGDTYVVKMGNFVLNFKKSELAPYVEKREPIKKTKVLPYGKNDNGILEVKQGKMELDLRGYRYEEVAPEVDKFINQALTSKLKVVYIIHGFGTGAVRKAVQDYLRKCSFVESTRYGGPGEGLNGVTVVTLK